MVHVQWFNELMCNMNGDDEYSKMKQKFMKRIYFLWYSYFIPSFN